jgi:hypothetical protein
MARTGIALNEFNQKLLKTDETASEKPYLFRNLVFQDGITTNQIYFDPSLLNRADGTHVSVQPFNTMTLLSNTLVNANITAFGNGTSGGRFSNISRSLDGSLAVNGGETGGSVNIAASDALSIGGSVSLVGTFHGGSIILKSLGKISSSSLKRSNGGLLGGTQQIFAETTFSNNGDLEANGDLNGGSIYIQAPQQIFNNSGHIQANGGQYSGFIRLISGSVTSVGPIEAKGSI